MDVGDIATCDHERGQRLGRERVASLPKRMLRSLDSRINPVTHIYQQLRLWTKEY